VYDGAVRVYVLSALCAWAAVAQAEPQHVLRLASIVPEGTGYARELKTLAQETQTSTEGRVWMKLYFGAVAGDELQAWKRVKRDQLDGEAAAAMLCERLSPSMRVLRVPGLFRNDREVVSVMSRLKPLFDAEAAQAGAHLLAGTYIGPVVLFTRQPARTVAELKRQTFWVWDEDALMTTIYPALGLKVAPMPIENAGRAYEEGRVDGFSGPPSGALAYQWSSTAHYYLDVPLVYLTGCIVVSSHAFDSLNAADQKALTAVAAKAAQHFNEVGAQMDNQLMNGLFRRQGLVHIESTPALQAELRASAKTARDALVQAGQIDPALLAKVEEILAELRSPHR
jgi:TRAP-type C4-dicarboxylate transport system substrate-binding protein